MKKIFIGLILFFCFNESFSQQLISPTLSSFGQEFSIGSKYLFMEISGETMSGLKFGNNHYIIEGFFPFLENGINTITLNPEIISEFIVFPNPTKSFFTIKYKNDTTVKVDIYQLSGIVVKSFVISSNSNIDISDFIPGIYLIYIKYKIGLKLYNTCSKLIVIK
jgi:hypothetical protein